jgi:hypothetical protein
MNMSFKFSRYVRDKVDGEFNIWAAGIVLYSIAAFALSVYIWVDVVDIMDKSRDIVLMGSILFTFFL